MRRAVVAAALISLLALGLGSAAAGAWAGVPMRDVRSGGRCTGGDSTYSLALSRYDRNTLRVRFRIANSTPGQTWQIFGSDNGARIFAVKRIVPSDGTVSVRKRTHDRRGRDRVKVAATNSASGEACNAIVKGF
jgi:hypothetical protein